MRRDQPEAPRAPTAILAGTNKSGTTSLHSALAHHPDICVSSVKETHVFTPYQTGIVGQAPGAEAYLPYFRHNRGEAVRLESTPAYYLGGRRLAETVRDVVGPTKVFFVLRDPVARAFSFFKMAREALYIPAAMSFSEYLDRCEEVGPEDVNRPELGPFLAVEGGCYARYLRPWLDAFPQRARAFFFEDMVRDPDRFLVEVVEWLEVDPAPVGGEWLGRKNESRGFRWLWLHRLARQFSTDRWGRLLPLSQEVRDVLRGVYDRINGQELELSLADADRRRLERLYAAPNQDLLKLCREEGWGTVDWLTGPGTPSPRR